MLALAALRVGVRDPETRLAVLPADRGLVLVHDLHAEEFEQRPVKALRAREIADADRDMVDASDAAHGVPFPRQYRIGTQWLCGVFGCVRRQRGKTLAERFQPGTFVYQGVALARPGKAGIDLRRFNTTRMSHANRHLTICEGDNNEPPRGVCILDQRTISVAAPQGAGRLPETGNGRACAKLSSIAAIGGRDGKNADRNA